MEGLPQGLQEVIDYFSRLPGIGKKTASRLAFSLLQKTPEYQKNFGEAVSQLSPSLSYCMECFHLCEKNQQKCEICTSQKREMKTLCVVENSLDVLAMEQSNAYRGKYFVLGGVISPMDGIGPSEIRMAELQELLLSSSQIEEVIFALSSTLEGESTATYIWRKLEEKNFSGKISRIARGIPLGSSLQYIDENTLSRALEGRQVF